MIERNKDVKIKSLTGETEVVRPTEVDRTSMFMKLAGAVIGSYYLSKEEPEAFKGFADEIKRQQTSNEDLNNDIIKDSSSTIASLLTKNALDRQERVDENFKSIEILNKLGLDTVYAAKASQDGYGTQLIALKKKYPNLDLNKAYKVIGNANIPGYSNKDFANVLTGKMTKPAIDYSKFSSQQSGLERALGFDSNSNFTDRLKQRVSSKNITSADMDSDKYSKGDTILSQLQLSDEIKNLLANAGAKGLSTTQSEQAIAKEISTFMGLDVGISGEGYRFEGEAKQNVKPAQDSTNAINIEVERILQVNNMSPKPDASLSRTRIRNMLIRKYFGRVKYTTNVKGKTIVEYRNEPLKKDGKYTINELDKNQDIIPNDWTSTGAGTVTTVPKTSSSKRAAEITRYKNLVAAIKAKPLSLMYTKIMQDKALAAAKAEHDAKLKAIK